MIDESADRPLVTIGIPTFNRLAGLKRALESAQRQDYPNIQIVISDNASSDDTRAHCLTSRDADSRITYIRQDMNTGPENNFGVVLAGATGELFMWLADDDWIDPNYVSACAGYLVQHQDFVLAAGYAKYADGDGSVGKAGVNAAITAATPRERIVDYYKTVLDNGAFYGVMRRAQLAKLPIRRIMGSDWFMMANLAAWGKIATLPETTLHRSAGGISRDAESMTRYYELKGWSAQQPFGMVAVNAAKEVLWRSPIFRNELSFLARAQLALQVYVTIIGRYADLGIRGPMTHRAWAIAHRMGFSLIRLLKPPQSLDGDV